MFFVYRTKALCSAAFVLDICVFEKAEGEVEKSEQAIEFFKRYVLYLEKGLYFKTIISFIVQLLTTSKVTPTTIRRTQTFYHWVRYFISGLDMQVCRRARICTFNALRMNLHVQCTPDESAKLLMASTCSYRLVIPIGHASFDEFKSAADCSISHGSLGFGLY